MPPLTLPFTSPAASLALAGGKGLNLAELARAQFPVPPGFIITTEAYHAFVAANGLQDRILAQVKAIAPDDPPALESASASIAALFADGLMPPAIADAITSAYHNLFPSSQSPTPNPHPVAVRSSATAEDLPGLSFAGQQETYLNIIGAEAVLDAVKKCWASLWTARAIGYRARNGIPPEEVMLAVVVQQLIASESSGVLFTANPLTGHRGEMVIDAAFGLGEAVVAGQVEPDHYVVESRTWAITERKLGAKALAIRPRAEGGTERAAGGHDAAAQSALSGEQLIDLAQLAGRVAEHFGSPQDIEWAWANNQLYLLQSRPITSLYPLPDVPIPPDALGVFFSVNSIQGVPEPFTPLGRDVLRLLLGGLVHHAFGLDVYLPHAIVDAGERMFLNFTEVARDPQLRLIMLALLERADPAARQIVLRLIAAGRLPLKRKRFHGPPRFIFHLLPRVLPGILLAQLAPQRALARGLAVAEGYLTQVRERAQSLFDNGSAKRTASVSEAPFRARLGTPGEFILRSPRRGSEAEGRASSIFQTDSQVAGPALSARLAVVESGLDRAAEHVVLPLVPAVVPAMLTLSLLDRWLVNWCGAQPGSALALLRGLSGNVTTEMTLKLWAAAQTIRADAPSQTALSARPIPELIADYQRQALPAVAQGAIEKFLAEYGMRAVTEIDIARPRWRDDPASIFQTLQSYLQLTDPAAAPDAVFRQGAAEAERLAADYVARARRSPFGWLRARILAFAIGRMRALAGARETPKLYIIKLFDIFRGLLLASAQELVTQGHLEHAEDIFFIPFETLKRAAQADALDLKEVVARNRADYERELTRRQMPRLLLSTGETFYGGLSGAGAGPDDLVGEAVSPGVVEGVVRVVLDPRGARLVPGEILVCPATDPGWTPLFLAAGGLVMEIGGMVTHGSVVAREYGIPAVVGVEAATTRLKTGQRVRVDGNTGRVTILE